MLFTKHIFGALKRKVIKPFSAWRLTQQMQGGSKNATHRHFEKLDQQFHLLLLIKKTAAQTRTHTHKLKMKKQKLKHIKTDSWGHLIDIMLALAARKTWFNPNHQKMNA